MNIGKDINKKKLFNSSSKEQHIIDDVPYVGQKNSIFCSYACQTMIFKYYNLNIDLDDLVFNSGIGYSLSYSKDYKNYFPIGGTLLSQWPLDRKFVAGLYGLEFETWFPTDLSCSIHEIWNVYWKKIKEYVKKDIPVSTGVDLVSLPAFRDLMNYNSWTNTKKIPNFAWKLISTAHEIVIVGFDEEKKLVYYNDPVALVLGKREEGIYASAPLDVFARAVANAKIGNFNPKFIINTYKKNKSPLSDEIIFKKSHDRNIQKLKGNPLSYDEKWRKYPLGIDALNAIIKDFEMMHKKKNNDLLASYKLGSFKNALMKKIPKFFMKKSSPLIIDDTFATFYEIISIEKKHAYKYIENKSINLKGLRDEIELLEQELEKWEAISKFYSRFYKEFILSTKNNKVKKINENLISNILEIINIEKRITEIY